MTTRSQAVFTKDQANKKLTVVRSFDASLQEVWDAWTKSEILDQWWAPKPYRAVTKTMDFREGGFWQYAMTGPEGDVQWCKEVFKSIRPQQSIGNEVSFCDEQGRTNTSFPVMYWKKEFNGEGDRTTVKIEITYDSSTDMETILKMGFEEGFTAGLDNLDEVLRKN